MADLQTFTNNVRNQLNGNAVGWAFAVYQGTTLKGTASGGMSVLSPQTKMTPQTRMGVMSMSKTVTAAALVASMPWMSVKPDSLIGPLARLGVWRFAGKNGEYFGHNGGYSPAVKNVVGSFAGWMAFPGGVTAAFVANSNLWFGVEQEKLLVDSFDAA